MNLDIPHDYYQARDLPTECSKIVALSQYIDELAELDIRSLPIAGEGRGAVRYYVANDGTELLIRQYRRGGLLRFLNKKKYLTPRRPMDELKTFIAAAERGVSTARAIGIIIKMPSFPFWECSIVTERIADAIDLGDYARWLPPAPTREVLMEKREITDAVGRAVRQLHDAGIFHADLQVKNILVRRGRGVEVFFIDFDKSVVHNGPLSEKLRAKNLRRLNRSVLKMNLEPPVLDDDDRRRFLAAYRAGDNLFGEDPAILMKSCERHAKRHSWGWRLRISDQ